MAGFIILAAIVLAISVFVLLRPIVRPPLLAEASSADTVDILREQRRELDADLANGTLSTAEHAQALTELAQRLAVEGTAAPAAVTTVHSARGWAWAVAVLLPAVSVAAYLKLGALPALDPANTQAPPEPAISAAAIEGMVERLAAKVKANPQDAQGLAMLARSYVVLNRYRDASDTYAKLAALKPDADVFVDWADALASAEGNTLRGEPEKLIARALELDPNNVKALALAGTAAFDRADYTTAQRHWENMARHVDPQSEIGQSAKAMVEEAKARAAEQKKK